MANTVTHNTTWVSGAKLHGSTWNEEHDFSGGSQGCALLRDTNATDGVAWSAVRMVFDTDPAVANLNIGHTAAPAYTTGHDNLFIGLNSGDSVTTGTGNLGIGHSALGSLVSGINNTAVGWDSQYASVGGNNNTSLGEDALKNVLTGGDNNTAVGYTAGYSITTGDDNVAIAPNALYTNQTGGQNIAIGYNALTLATTSDNVAVGYGALATLSSGSKVTALGRSAGAAQTTVNGGVFLGYAAGFYETGANKLFIDNAVRADEADARVKALIYGVFATTVAGQSVVINGTLTVNSATLLTTSQALTNGAAAQTATMTNGPTAGNPTKWVPINDNGTVRYIPAW